MPLPKPQKQETETEFLERCMADELMRDEYPENDQRFAVCNSIWRDKKMADIERKGITLEFKGGDDEGSFSAQIATLDVVDSDGDLTRPGAFPEGKELLVSAYQHGSWAGALPVGKAVVREVKDGVIADGQFNLQTATGKEHYEAVKFTGKLQEWSYGFLVLATGSDKELDAYAEAHDGARPGRIITKVDPFEISPVLKGAGVGTATLGIKAGMSYAEHMEAVLAAVSSAADRTKSLADLRRKDGRDLSPAHRERMESLLDSLGSIKANVEELLVTVEPDDENRKALDALFLEFTRINYELTEV